MNPTDDGDDLFRRDADILQAELEAAGNRAGRAYRRMAKLYLADLIEQAADACPHGWVYPLDSVAASEVDDPRRGERGFRCIECGSALGSDPMEGPAVVVVPCELRPHFLTAKGASR